jgi:hypothetical protein
MSESKAPPRNDVRASRTAEPLNARSRRTAGAPFHHAVGERSPGSQLGGGFPYELGRLTGERAVGDRYPRDRGPDGTHVLSGCTRRRWLARRRADWLIGPPDHSTSRRRSLIAPRSSPTSASLASDASSSRSSRSGRRAAVVRRGGRSSHEPGHSLPDRQPSPPRPGPGCARTPGQTGRTCPDWASIRLSAAPAWRGEGCAKSVLQHRRARMLKVHDALAAGSASAAGSGADPTSRSSAAMNGGGWGVGAGGSSSGSGCSGNRGARGCHARSS